MVAWAPEVCSASNPSRSLVVFRVRGWGLEGFKVKGWGLEADCSVAVAHKVRTVLFCHPRIYTPLTSVHKGQMFGSPPSFGARPTFGGGPSFGASPGLGQPLFQGTAPMFGGQGSGLGMVGGGSGGLFTSA